MEKYVLARPGLTPEGKSTYKAVPVCTCENKRGPVGGVCDNCGEAIPTKSEQAVIDKNENK